VLAASQVREFNRNGCLIGRRVIDDAHAPTRDAGPHFPHVGRGGKAVPPPTAMRI
jgi:hypothetical protein